MNNNFLSLSKNNLIQVILDNKLYCDDRGNIYHPDYEHALSKSTGMWQFPDEFADLMLFLYDKPINTFLNIGTYNGVSFNLLASFLNACRKVKCISIDPINHNPIILPNFEYNDKISLNYKDQKFDLVFIDGDHSYDSVKTDYENVGKFAKYCVFHDIDDDFIRNDPSLNGGVARFWDEIKSSKSHIEFNSSKKIIKMMGIGVLYE
jgi:hypothetical protein